MQLIVDKDDATLSQSRVMTLVIELEQRFQNVDQVDRRSQSNWWSLSNEWCFRKIEARKKVTQEEQSFSRQSHGDVDVEEHWNEGLP
jgi:hypothetical protein